MFLTKKNHTTYTVLFTFLLINLLFHSCQFSKQSETPKKHIITLNSDNTSLQKASITETNSTTKVTENQLIKDTIEQKDSIIQEKDNLSQHSHIKKAWETATIFQTPESTLYDQERDIIYVSNINGKPIEEDHNGFLSKLNTDGSIHTQQWILGLSAPKGMAIKDSILYVTDINRLVAINLNKEQIVASYRCIGSEFLNDVAVDDSTRLVYISDSGTAQIYQLDGDSTFVWLRSKEFDRPNGLYLESNLLYVGSKGRILVIDTKTQEKVEFITGTGATDGIVKVDSNRLYVSDWQGEIFEVDIALKEKKSVLDSKKNKINSADIGFVPELNLLLVPTFFGNTVSAYKVEKSLP